MKLAICLLALTSPYWWEIWKERKGEAANAKTKSVIVRVGIAIVAAIIGFVLIGKAVFDGVFLSLSFHWLAFDYSIAYLLIAGGIVEPRNAENWFTYLGSTSATDKLRFWRNMNPWLRFAIRVVVLATAIIIYIA